MTDLRDAARQALEFVTSKQWGTTPYMDVRVYEDAARLRDTLRAALEQPKPPPEAQTEAEKIAYCAGWWAAMEQKREQPEQEPDRWGAGYEAGYAAGMAEMKPGQEPVALQKLLHQVICGDFNADNTDDLKLALAARKDFAALQLRREWRSLSEEELTALGIIHSRYQEESLETGGWFDFARAVEAALKERNHG
jgi:hypothetical protein